MSASESDRAPVTLAVVVMPLDVAAVSLRAPVMLVAAVVELVTGTVTGLGADLRNSTATKSHAVIFGAVRPMIC